MLLVLAWASVSAQFRTGVDLVELYVSVVDERGAPIAGLVREDFEVVEDGRRQELSLFSAGQAPLALAVAVDRSFSVAGPRLDVMKTALAALIDRLPADARLLLLGVGSRVDTLSPFGTDRAAQSRALAALDAFGSTSLHDAIIEAVDRLPAAEGRRALLLLSDGVDRFSRTTAAEVVTHIRTRDVLVFPVTLGARTPPLFTEAAAVTGGRAVNVRDPSQLSATLQTLLAELGAQYLLGYAPARRDPQPLAPQAGTGVPSPSSGASAPVWRSVRVTVRLPGLIARTRQGYWAR
jgi:Ca-activated chloride channel family protein